jgi:succinyl-diaminopimelate desuccinylase
VDLMTNADDKFRLLSERLGALQPEMIDLQRELVSRNAVGPEDGGPGEGEKAAFLLDLLRSWGLQVQNFPAPDPLAAGGQRPNLVAWLPGRRPEKVWVLSHLDVVPPGDESLWHSDPFTLRVEGDRL